tara:strand:+ start:6832 stop:8349 length:1518 start_codon:yes stop_codon:yes gene_type:complete
MTDALTRLLGTAIAHPTESTAQLEKIRCEGSLLEFVKAGWHALEPGTEFLHGWAVEAMAEALERVTNGDIRRLLINVPPGCTKSMLVNVFWPAWEWGPKSKADYRYINASYGADLSIRDNMRCRDLIQSEWYQANWGDRFQMKGDQNAKILYENDRTGWRFAASVGKGITGRRGDRIIVDDPHSVENVESDVVRERALRWFFETLSSRYNKLDESAMVVIMQRVHDRDLSGAIIAKMAEGKLNYEHLCLPMEFETDHPHKSTRFVDPRTEDGELLWPERFSPNAVDEQKETFRAWGGTYAEAGQLQQRPVPRGGGMFKRDDIEVLDGIPAHATVVARARGWDLAATDSSRAAYTVGCKIAKLADGRIVIEDVVRGRWGPAEVEAKLLACANVDGPGIVQFIPQDPGQAGKSQVRAFAAMLEGHNARFSPESGDKETRAIPIAAQAEAGNLAMVRAPWNDALLAEMTLFPAGQFKDQVDALTRAYDWLLQNRAPAIATVPGRMIEK